MRLNQNQIHLLAKYLADFSKIIVASTIIGFFIPTGSGPITLPVFGGGTIAALLSLWVSVRLLK